MARFNTDVIFIDTSGQVRVISGDLTLRANPNGDGHIIVGSGISLRPEVNCDALDAMDLGQADLRWKTLFACSGNFLDRPTVNGSGVVLQGESVAAGVDTINGLSGVVTLASVNDAITITENGQTIEFSGIFTQASGTLLENIAGTLGSGVVNLLNGLSGVIDLVSPDGSVIITPSGNDIALQVDPVGLTTIIQGIGFSGLFNSVFSEATENQTTNSLTFVQALRLQTPEIPSGNYRIAWSLQASADDKDEEVEYRIEIDDTIELMLINPSFNLENQALQFGGFTHQVLASGTHTIDLDFRNVEDTDFSSSVDRARIDMWRL